MSNNICIAVADDHMLFRKGVIELVSGFEGMEVVTEACDGQELIENIQKGDIMPDVCLLDIRMPRLNGYEALPMLRSKWKDMRILVLSMHDHDYSVISMLRMGAAGFINKDVSPDILQHAITTAYQTGYYHSDIEPRMFASLAYQGKKDVVQLSRRELTFLNYCCSDMTYEEIARKLDISVRTVDGYRENLFRKFNIHSRAGLVVFAMQSGLIRDIGGFSH